MTAHVSIVFARYMMLSVTQRCNTDNKTICELYFCLMDELDDITFSQSMRIIIDTLMESVMEYFHISERQLEEFTTSFVQRLPKYIQKALESGSIATWLLFYELKYWFFKVLIPFLMCEVWVNNSNFTSNKYLYTLKNQ